MVLITFFMIYLFTIKSVLILKTGQVIDNQLITSYYRHLFRLPQRFFDSMKTGEIISRINDAVKIRGFINDAAIGIFVNIMVVFFSFSTMGTYPRKYSAPHRKVNERKNLTIGEFP